MKKLTSIVEDEDTKIPYSFLRQNEVKDFGKAYSLISPKPNSNESKIELLKEYFPSDGKFGSGSLMGTVIKIGLLTAVTVGLAGYIYFVVLDDPGGLLAKLIEFFFGGMAVGDVTNGDDTGGGCVAENTLISTPKGYKEVQDLDVGDLVMGFDTETGERLETKVTRKYSPKGHFSPAWNYEGITFTWNHKIYVNGEWVGVKELAEDETEYEGRVHNIETGTQNYFGRGESENDILIHNVDLIDKLPYLIPWWIGKFASTALSAQG